MFVEVLLLIYTRTTVSLGMSSNDRDHISVFSGNISIYVSVSVSSITGTRK